MLNIKIKKLNPQARIPEKMSDLAAGYDLFSSNPQDLILKSNRIKLIPTGIALSIPAGYEVQIRPRSGLAIKHGIGILNSPGTIDADYRGIVGVILINHSQNPFEIKRSDRIAQLVIQPVNQAELEEFQELKDTERGLGGFGSTGH